MGVIPSLPPVEQVFTVSAGEFMAGISEMLEGVEKLAAGIDEVAAAADRLSATADVAGEADDRLAAGIDEVAASADRLAVAADIAADADERLSAAEQLAAIDAERQAAAVDALVASCEETVAAVDEATVAIDRETVALEESGDAAKDTGAEGLAFGGMMKTALLGVAIAAGIGIEQAGKFQQGITQLHTQAGVATSQLGTLSQGVLKLAGAVGQGPESLTESLYHVESNMASLGISSAKALNMVQVAAEGADVGRASLVDVTNALTAAVASGIPGVQNYQQAMGALNATVGAGDMQMQDLADAMGTGMLAVVKGYGLSLTDVGAALATFGDNNIRGAKAGTDLRMSVQALAVPMATAGAQLSALGMNSKTLSTDMENGGLMKALDDLTNRFHKAGITAKTEGEVITTLFGKKAGAGVSILLEQMSRLQSKYPQIEKAAGDFGNAWQGQQKTLSQQWADLKNGVDALAISFGEKLLPVATKVVGALAKFANFLEKNPALAAFAGALLAVAAAFKLVATAEALFDAVTDANPVMLVLMAVILLAAGLYELYKHCKLVRDAVADVGKFFKAAGHDIADATDAVRETAIRAGHDIEAAWHDIKNGVDAVRETFIRAGHDIEAALNAVAKWISGHWKEILAWLVDPVGMAVFEIRTHTHEIAQAFDKMRHDVAAILDDARHDVSAAFDDVRHDIAAFADWVPREIEDAWDTARHDTMSFLDGLRHDISAAFDWLGSTTRSVISDVVGFFSKLPGEALRELEALPGQMLTAGKNIINGLINGIKNAAAAIPGIMKGLASDVESYFTDPLKMFSPSRVFFQHGVNTLQGYINGLRSMTPQVLAAMHEIGGHVASGGIGAAGLAVAGGTAAGGGTGGGTSIGPITLTVNGFVGNQQELMQQLYYQFQQIVLQQNRRNSVNGLSLTHP